MSEHARDLPHARLLELAWAGGPRLLLGFDQGLGFVEAKRRERFPLMEPSAAQVSALLAARVELLESDTWVWTQIL